MNDNMPEYVDLTFSKVDDTFLDRLAQYIDQMKDQRERYILNWTGRGGSFVEAGKPLDPAKTLRPDVQNSVNFDTTKNLFITGDNLEALKLLQESYLGKVDMIYVDPPYNTGSDLLYYDDFKVSYSDEINNSRDEDGARQLTVNPKENGRYHSDWLSMMYPRLILARNFLSDKGVIFISIDSNELSNIISVCDEVFGQQNRLGILSIVNNLKGRSDDAFFATSNEFALCYAKKLSDAVIKGFPMTQSESSEYKLSDGISRYKEVSLQKTGKNSRRIDRPNMYYPIYYDPTTCVFSDKSFEGALAIYPTPINGVDGRWRWGRSTFLANKDTELTARKIGDNWRIYVKMRDVVDGTPRTIRPKTTWINPKYDTGSGGRTLKDLLGGKIFDNPKSVDLISDFIEIGSNSDSIVLDFFAGSGTTAQAVMQQNAKDGGYRQFILVQLPEQCNEKSEAYKAGYKTIDELSRERIRRAAKKIAAEDEHADQHDYGFRAMYIDYANENDGIERTASQTNQTDILNMANNIRNGRTPLDLLFGVLLQKGWNMDGQLTRLDINGNEVLTYDHIDGAPGTGVVACFDHDINPDTVQQIIDMAPQAAVFRDSSFKSSSDKINLVERFRTANSGGVTTGVWVI